MGTAGVGFGGAGIYQGVRQFNNATWWGDRLRGGGYVGGGLLSGLGGYYGLTYRPPGFVGTGGGPILVGPNDGPVTVLYHGGKLTGGQVQPRRISLTTSPEHAALYAAKTECGEVYRFEVPTEYLLEAEKRLEARMLLDLLKDNPAAALEWRLYGESADGLNQFRVK